MSLSTYDVKENEIPGRYEFDWGRHVLEISEDHTYVHRYIPDSGEEQTCEGTWEYPIPQLEGVKDIRFNDFYAFDSTWHTLIGGRSRRFDPDSVYWEKPRIWETPVVRSLWGEIVIITDWGGDEGASKQ
jgi:hypothetical protein